MFASGMEMGASIQNNAFGPEVESYNLNPQIQNGGNTPAKNLVIWMNYYTPTDAMAPDYGFPDLSDVIKAAVVAGPKNFAKVPIKRFTPAQFVEFQANTRHLYAYGHAEYDDRFPGTPHHVTMYCFELTSVRGNPRGVSSVPPNQGTANLSLSIVVDFPACSRHNCTDEECKGL
jgi:hypothetical protein